MSNTITTPKRLADIKAWTQDEWCFGMESKYAMESVLYLIVKLDSARKALAYYAKREDWESWNGSDYCQFLNAACDGWEIAENELTDQEDSHE